MSSLFRQRYASLFTSALKGVKLVHPESSHSYRSFAIRNMSSGVWDDKKALRKSTAQKLKNLEDSGMRDQSEALFDMLTA